MRQYDKSCRAEQTLYQTKYAIDCIVPSVVCVFLDNEHFMKLRIISIFVSITALLS